MGRLEAFGAALPEAEEAAARRDGTSLWVGAFVIPWDWRRRTPGTTVLGAGAVPVTARAILLNPAGRAGSSSPGRAIKGNIGRGGERIYHAPGGRGYARVRNDARKGERWFCSSEEAEGAGWRAPRR